MQHKVNHVRILTRCAMLVAVLCVCGWITIPLGDVALTLQTFGVFLTLRLLGGRQGTVTICVYLLLGAVGLPVFSGFRGGLGMLLGATGGYLMGFAATGLVYWAVVSIFGQRWMILGLALGLLGCYGFGTGWYLLLYSDSSAIVAVIMKCVFPFLIPDAVKMALACSLGERLKSYKC